DQGRGHGRKGALRAYRLRRFRIGCAVMSVAVVSDTCHYLPADVGAANAISLVSLYVHTTGDAQRESDISSYDNYYEQLKDLRSLPTTSQPSIGVFLAVYEPLLEAGHEI